MSPAGPSSRENPRPEDAPPPRWRTPLIIVASTVALVAGVLGVNATTGGSDSSRQGEPVASATEPGAVVVGPSELAQPDLSSEESRDPDDLLAEGPVDAPVTIVVFSDYQCPYCAQWTAETAPVLREYVDRGELRIEWREVNIFGEDSERAARAALAAAMQGAHEEYQARLVEGGTHRSGDELSEEALISLAGELGLDTDRFAEDMASAEVAQTIGENAQQGIDLGAMSTPAFIVDGRPMVGAQPTEVFTALVDEALAEEG
ncbi:DsbA family protein [Brachybacterium sp. DNPG3]